MPEEYRKENFVISTDPKKIDLETVHQFLTNSYWAKGISKETIQRSIENSLCFGIYDENQQMGFARVISDYATYAYLCDVFILENHRGHGLASWLIECIMKHPFLQKLRRFQLVTTYAHGLYKQFGFSKVKHPERHMEIYKSKIYLKEYEA